MSPSAFSSLPRDLLRRRGASAPGFVCAQETRPPGAPGAPSALSPRVPPAHPHATPAPVPQPPGSTATRLHHRCPRREEEARHPPPSPPPGTLGTLALPPESRAGCRSPGSAKPRDRFGPLTLPRRPQPQPQPAPQRGRQPGVGERARGTFPC